MPGRRPLIADEQRALPGNPAALANASYARRNPQQAGFADADDPCLDEAGPATRAPLLDANTDHPTDDPLLEPTAHGQQAVDDACLDGRVQTVHTPVQERSIRRVGFACPPGSFVRRVDRARITAHHVETRGDATAPRPP